jgi:hypothetical protein
MRNMLILVKREVEDHAIHYVLAVVMGCIASMIIYVFNHMADVAERSLWDDVFRHPLMVIFPCFMILGAVFLASVQIAGDRRAKISTFICTLTPTRGQLLVAKWVSGLVWILLAVGPLLLTLTLKGEIMGLYAPLIRAVLTGIIVLQVTGYAVGQQIGFVEKKGLALMVSALFLCLMGSLLVIKGLAMPCYALLAVLTVALCVRSWWSFHHMAL